MQPFFQIIKVFYKSKSINLHPTHVKFEIGRRLYFSIATTEYRDRTKGIQNMDEHHFNVVCKECHTPSVFKKASLISDIIFICIALAGLFVAFAGGWIGIATWIACVLYGAHSSGKRKRKCTKCGMDALIPIDSPKGATIMQNNGWIES